MRMSRAIDPRAFIETDGVDHERITFPTSHRVAQPRKAVKRVARRMRSTIHVDFAPYVSTALKNDHDAFLLRKLEDFGRIWRAHKARAPGRQAVPFGVVFRII